MKIVVLDDEDIVLFRGSLWSRNAWPRELWPWVIVAFMTGMLLARAYYMTVGMP